MLECNPVGGSYVRQPPGLEHELDSGMPGALDPGQLGQAAGGLVGASIEWGTTQGKINGRASRRATREWGAFVMKSQDPEGTRGRGDRVEGG